MIRVLILNPPFLKRYSRQSRSPCVTKGGTFYYPYYLAYATGALEKAGHEVKLLDAVAKDFTLEDTIRFAEDFSPELAVLDTSTPSIYNDVKVASGIKASLPDMHVNLVGTHPTALVEETFDLSPSIDSICRGEYDYTLVDLAKALANGDALNSVEGLSYRAGDRIVHNRSREPIKNLDELPFVTEVYRKHLNIGDYFYASLTYPQVTILTARGCPYNCSFCNAFFKNSYRARSVENVVAEFEYIQKELPGVKEVMIEDETFPINKKRTLEFCQMLRERGITLRWSCNVRVNTDYETLKAMRDAGCRLLCVGFESPTQESLDSVKKRTTREMQFEFMCNVKKLGLLVNGCFILGLPGDTRDTIEKTIEFSKELNPDTAQFYPLMVYPGTIAYEWAKENGYLITEDYSKWIDDNGMHTTVVSRPGLSNSELVELCDRARREFYIRPAYLIYKLKQSILHPREGWRNIKSSRTFLKHLRRTLAIPRES
jgi:radical SAM superfamily enzyme YgiQ (UPF0313 family)